MPAPDREASRGDREASPRGREALRRNAHWPAEHRVLAAALYGDKPHAYHILRRLDPGRLAAYLEAVRTIEYLAHAISVLQPYREPGGDRP
jgi:hypothetical protein